MRQPRISIITPTFNQAEFLPATLDSVMIQEYPNFEHIIVDAMSTDSTEEILADYSTRQRVRVVREKDRGQSDGINKGAELATGELVCWLNSDDALEPRALETVADAFVRHPDAVAICGVGSKMDRAGTISYQIPFRPFDRVRFRSALEHIQPASFYRRDAWVAVGALDITLHYAMDWDLLLRLERIGPILTIPDALARLRCYDETKTSTGGWGRAAEIARVGRRHNGLFDLNNLSFIVRSVAPRIPLLRRCVDGVFWKIGKRRPVMVQGWPE